MTEFDALIAELSDDQVTELARIVISEMLNRSAATRDAAGILMLDAAERKRILETTDEDERRAIRARERIEIAQMARAQARAEEEARINRDAELRRLSEARTWLVEAGSLLDMPPRDLRIVRLENGKRVLIDKANAPFGEHLVDWRPGMTKTKRHLIARKPDIAALCARFATESRQKEINGRDYFAE